MLLSSTEVKEANLPPRLGAVDAEDCRGFEYRCDAVAEVGEETSTVWCAELAAEDNTLDLRRDENGGGIPEELAKE